jgi:hypothetical protein
VRWLQRWLEETDAPTIEDAALTATGLAALGGPRHAEALLMLKSFRSEGTGSRLAASVRSRI